MNSSSRTMWAALAVAVLARPAGAKLLEDVVATVNGSPVLLSDFQNEFKNAVDLFERQQPGAVATPERVKALREKVLEQLIDYELIHQEGGKLKLKVRERDVEQAIEDIKKRFSVNDAGEPTPQPEVEELFRRQLKAEGITFPQFRERISRQVLIQKVIDSEVQQKVRLPEEKDVKDYFDKVKAYIATGSTAPPAGMDPEAGMLLAEVANDVRLMSSERVSVSRILVRFCEGAGANERKRAKAAALDIKKRLDAGAVSFADMARAESEDPESAARGGDIGMIFKGRVPPEIEKAAFSLDVGKVSDPIETPTGFHILRVVEKRAAGTPEFAEFRDRLGKFLANVRYNDSLGTYVKGLRAKAHIERNLPAAP